MLSNSKSSLANSESYVVYLEKDEIKKFENDMSCDVLIKLISDIRNGKDVPKCVDNLGNEDLVNIYGQLYNESIGGYSNLDISIILSSIKFLLKKWENYFRSDREETIIQMIIHLELSEYLKENINMLLSMKDQAIQRLEGLKIEKLYVEVQCPPKKLKTIFFNEIPPGDDIINSVTPSVTNDRNAQFISSKDILNWPNVGFSVMFNNFRVTHRILLQSEYKLIHFKSDYRPVHAKRSTKLACEGSPGRKTVPSCVIAEYINEMKQFIRVNGGIRIGRKVDVLSVLSELKIDIELCKDAVCTDVEYVLPTSDYPYVRYLGLPNGSPFDECAISYEDQTKVNQEAVNIRLQETARPVIIFSVQTFDVEYIKKDSTSYEFVMDPANLPTGNSLWLVYECLICKKVFNSYVASEDLSKHLVNEHSSEPDWFCVRCGNSFSTRKLSCERWSHQCTVNTSKSKSKKS